MNTLIRETLPQFAPDVPPAFAAGDLEAVKKVPRRDRKQILISAYTSRYNPDLTAVLAAGGDISALADSAIDQPAPTSFAADLSTAITSAAPSAAAAAATPRRGYQITVKCSTPNAAGAAMFVSYINALQASPPTPDRPWKVVAATIVRQQTLGNDANRMAAMATAYTTAEKLRQTGIVSNESGTPGAAGPPSGLGGGPDQGFDPAQLRGGTGLGGGLGSSSNTVPPEAYEDPVLHEDVRADTEAVIVLVIELDPAPAAPPVPGAPGATPPKAVALAAP